MGSSSSSNAKVTQVKSSTPASEANQGKLVLTSPRSTPYSPRPTATPRGVMPSPVPTQNMRGAPNGPSSTPINNQSNGGSKPEDEITFETFHHRTGKTYCCIYTNGMRFYLDSFETGEWVEFPFSWYEEGTLVVDEIESMEGFMESTNRNKQRNDRHRSRHHRKSSAKGEDDREGIINVPGKGALQTYVFQYRRNIHCYYDVDEGSWIKLPIQWELATNLARSTIKKVKDVLPLWKDDFDILATLRACNYNVEDAISNFHATSINGKDPGSSRAIPINTASTEALEKKLKDYEGKLKDLIGLIKREREHKEYYKKKMRELEEQLAVSRSECKSVMVKLDTLAANRPKTPVIKRSDENCVRRETLLQLQIQLKHLHRQQFQLKIEMDSDHKEFLMQMQKAAGIVSQIGQTESSQNSEIEELRTLYRKEALQRKLLYNQLQELRGNIRVFCRCRYDPSSNGKLSFPSDQDILVAEPSKKTFQFDRAFAPNSTQEEVFKEVLPIITSCADGYNICILAYGQTGSGKTFTMQGPEKDPGVNIRAIIELLKICSEREKVEYRLTLSMVEIYNESVQDLLSSGGGALELRSQGNRVVLPGLTECPVRSRKDIDAIMKLGETNRTVASTKMNAHSSRSHLLVMLVVNGKDKVSGALTRGQLTMCDLAGSERVSKTEAQGTRLTEAAFINKSLTALGQVFTALRLNQLHVPYRNSKLTHILQSSLGGDAKACLFVNISPDERNNSETISTLQFGSNARQVSLGQAKQNISKKS